MQQLLRSVALALRAGAAIPPLAQASATIYYIDPADGNDTTNDGLSPQSADAVQDGGPRDQAG